MALRLGGMTAYELMERMTYAELLEWCEYDQCVYDHSWIQHAVLCAKIDAATWTKGRPRPDMKRYLPKVKKPRPRKANNVQEIRRRFDLALGNLSLETFGLKQPETNG
jgi:hypothetical protein